MAWYLAYLLALALLWGFSSPRDRAALRLVLMAGVASHLLMAGLRWTDASWKLAFPATVETLTIIALLRWAPNRTGYTQAGLLVIAWMSHVLCYWDILTGGNLVYDAYEKILGFVAVGQLAACHDTIRRSLVALWDALLRMRDTAAVPAPSGCAPVLHSSRPPGI